MADAAPADSQAQGQDLVPMWGPDGTPFRVSRAEVPEALKRGATQASAQQVQAYLQRQAAQAQQQAQMQQLAQTRFAPGMRPGQIPMDLASQILQNRNAQVMNDMTTQRVMAEQRMRGQQGIEKTEAGQVQITPEMIASNPDLKKKGITPGLYPASFASSVMKAPSATTDQNLTPDEQNALVNATLRTDNPLAPSEITFRGPRAKVMAQALMKDPAWTPNKGEAGLSGARATAQAGGRTKATQQQELGSLVQSLDTTIDQIDPLVQRLSPTSISAANEAFRKGLSRVAGDPDATELLVKMVAARGMYASVLKNGKTPDEKSEAEAEKAISDGLGKGAWSGAAKAMRDESQARMGGVETGYTGNKKTAQGAPKAGVVENGYKFKGGDPADPANWEKQ